MLCCKDRPPISIRGRDAVRCTSPRGPADGRRGCGPGCSPMITPSAAREERDLWDFGPDDVHLVVSPSYHSAPLRFAAGTLLAGGSIAVLPAFEPSALIDAINTIRPTSMFCVPAHLQRLFARLDEHDSPIDTSSLRLVAHAGAPCPEPIRRRATSCSGSTSSGSSTDRPRASSPRVRATSGTHTPAASVERARDGPSPPTTKTALVRSARVGPLHVLGRPGEDGKAWTRDPRGSGVHGRRPRPDRRGRLRLPRLTA